MKRVWDDFGFAVWFVGLGYIAWWLIGAPAWGRLTPTLHVIGLTAATIVAIRLLVLAIGRWREPLSTGAMPTAVPAPDAADETSGHERPAPLPTVKPRSHFGLRDAPH